jgi:low affinity Fe/Cu permease
MRTLYRFLERVFEKITVVITAALGNSITFILAFCTVVFWICSKEFYLQDIHKSIGEIILGITFLSLFIIQKTFNRLAVSIHVKLNELVASHDNASNDLISIEEKTEQELIEISKDYAELATLVKSDKNKRTSVNNDK